MSDNKSQKADEQKGKRNERKAADLYEKGRQFMCMGNPQAAFECYTRSLQVRPTEKVFISRAVLNVEMKRVLDALSDANEALKLDPAYDPAIRLKTIVLNMMNRKDEADKFLDDLPGTSAGNDNLVKELKAIGEKVPCFTPRPNGVPYKDGIFQLEMIGGQLRAKHPDKPPYALAKLGENYQEGSLPEGVCGFETLTDVSEELNKIAKKNGILLKIKLMHVKIDEDLIEFFRSLSRKQRMGNHVALIRCKCSATHFEQLFDANCLSPMALLLDGPEGIEKLNMSEVIQTLPIFRNAAVRSLCFNESLMSDSFRADINERPIFSDIQRALDWLHTPWTPPPVGEVPAIDLTRKELGEDAVEAGKMLSLDKIRLGVQTAELVDMCVERFMDLNQGPLTSEGSSSLSNKPSSPYNIEIHSRKKPDLSGTRRINVNEWFLGTHTNELFRVQLMNSSLIDANGEPKYWVTRIERKISKALENWKEKENQKEGEDERKE